jgi:7,8-dihydropterin-6-yl-methyl-4-(beta-D-ribofuranosyl)aminobenzene 5'-phosphate synthase
VHPGMFRQRATGGRDGVAVVNELVARSGATVGRRRARNLTRASRRRSPMVLLLRSSARSARVTPYEPAFRTISPQRRRRVLGKRPAHHGREVRLRARQGQGPRLCFSACSHAGLINVLTPTRAHGVPVGACSTARWAGCTWPAPKSAVIPQTVDDLSSSGLKLLAPGHCTGWARPEPDGRATTARSWCRPLRQEVPALNGRPVWTCPLAGRIRSTHKKIPRTFEDRGISSRKET